MDVGATTREERLAVATQLAALGAYYALHEDGLYAAAGLLSAAYDIRQEILAGDHQSTVQVALMLGPVYEQMGRLDDAEKLYLDAFHALARAISATMFSAMGLTAGPQ